MKKCFISIALIISCFFICGNLNAKTEEVLLTDGGIDAPLPTSYNAHVFNYFEEKKNNTLFYNLLAYYGTDFIDYLFSLNSNTYLNNSSDFKIFIFTSDEVDEFCNSSSDYTEAKFCQVDFSTYTHLVTIVYDLGNNIRINNHDNQLFFDYTLNGEISGPINFYYFNDSNFVSTSSVHNIFHGDFSSNESVYHPLTVDKFYTNLISNYKYSYNWVKTGWWIFGSNSYGGTDFAYMLSKLYSSSDVYYINSLSSKPTINIENYVFNNVGYTSDSLPNNYNLNYYKSNPLISSDVPFKSFLNTISDSYVGKIVNAPNDFTKIDLNDYTSVLLVPKITANTDKSKYRIYSYTGNGSSYFTWYTSLISISSTDKVLGFSVSTKSLQTVDFPYNFSGTEGLLIKSENKKYDNFIYIDTQFYDVYYYTGTNSNTVIINNSEYSITEKILTDLYNTYFYNYGQGSADLDNLTESTYIGTGTVKDWIEYEKNNKDKDTIDLNLTNILSSAWDGAKTFIGASNKLVSLTTSMFVALPKEVSSIILCSFTIGAIILLFKLFH